MPRKVLSTKSSENEHVLRLTRLVEKEAFGGAPGEGRWEISREDLYAKYRSINSQAPPHEPGLSFEEIQPRLTRGLYVNEVRVTYNAFLKALVFERVLSPETLERRGEISREHFWKVFNEQIDSLSGFQFERLVSEILRNLPWVEDVEETKLTGDDGVDFRTVIQDDVLGRVVALGQVKKTKARVTAGMMREFVGTLDTASSGPVIGIFVSLAGFSKPALEARDKASVPIRTVSGDEFIEWLSKYNIGIRTTQLNILALDPSFWAEIHGSPA